MIIFFIKYVIEFLFIFIILAILRTWQMEHSKNQQVFVGGHIPVPMPDGFYNGGLIGRKVYWLGKKFDVSDQTGINVFNDLVWGKKEKYPFKTYIGKGLKDKNTDVLKIDYNIPTNSFWTRFILDEIVEVAPNEYLGKFHVRVIPRFPFTLGYFCLKK